MPVNALDISQLDYDKTVEENANLFGISSKQLRRYLSSICKNGESVLSKFRSTQLSTGAYLSWKAQKAYRANPTYCAYRMCVKMHPYEKRHNKYCDNTCAALGSPPRKHTPETKAKMSTIAKQGGLKGNWHVLSKADILTGALMRIKNKEQVTGLRNTRVKVSIASENQTTRMYQITCSTCKASFYNKRPNKYCSPTCRSNNPKAGGIREGSGRSKTGYYKGYYCGSTWELAWIIYQIDHNIPFARNEVGFTYNFKGKFHKYYPDFKLPNNTYVEIKGYKTPQWEAKVQHFPHSLKVIYKAEIQEYLKYAKTKYKTLDLVILYEKASTTDQDAATLDLTTLEIPTNTLASPSALVSPAASPTTSASIPISTLQEPPLNPTLPSPAQNITPTKSTLL